MLKSLTLLAVTIFVATTAASAEAQQCRKSQQATFIAHRAAPEAVEDEKNIVEIAAGNDDFSTLVAAVKAAGLVETLTGDGPFTVFAPTNEAFAKLPAGTVESLLKPENKEKLIAILKYHVVPGKVMAADVVKLSEAETAQGGKVKIMTKDSKVMVDNATVVKTDIAGSNGVIHVIDTVIMPKK